MLHDYDVFLHGRDFVFQENNNRIIYYRDRIFIPVDTTSRSFTKTHTHTHCAPTQI